MAGDPTRWNPAERDVAERCRTPMPDGRACVTNYAGLWSTLRGAEEDATLADTAQIDCHTAHSSVPAGWALCMLVPSIAWRVGNCTASTRLFLDRCSAVLESAYHRSREFPSQRRIPERIAILTVNAHAHPHSDALHYGVRCTVGRRLSPECGAGTARSHGAFRKRAMASSFPPPREDYHRNVALMETLALPESIALPG